MIGGLLMTVWLFQVEYMRDILSYWTKAKNKINTMEDDITSWEIMMKFLMNFNYCLNIQWIYNEESRVKKSTEINLFGKLSAFSLNFDFFCFPFAENDQKFVQKLAELWLNKEFSNCIYLQIAQSKSMKMKENR